MSASRHDHQTGRSSMAGRGQIRATASENLRGCASRRSGHRRRPVYQLRLCAGLRVGIPGRPRAQPDALRLSADRSHAGLLRQSGWRRNPAHPDFSFLVRGRYRPDVLGGRYRRGAVGRPVRRDAGESVRADRDRRRDAGAGGVELWMVHAPGAVVDVATGGDGAAGLHGRVRDGSGDGRASRHPVSDRSCSACC